MVCFWLGGSDDDAGGDDDESKDVVEEDDDEDDDDGEDESREWCIISTKYISNENKTISSSFFVCLFCMMFEVFLSNRNRCF